MQASSADFAAPAGLFEPFETSPQLAHSFIDHLMRTNLANETLTKNLNSVGAYACSLQPGDTACMPDSR